MSDSKKQVLKPGLALAAGATLCAGLLWQSAFSAPDNGVGVPPAKAHLQNNTGQTQTTVLAGGCFWGMEEVFHHVKGVTHVVAGYAGGTKAHANYNDSSSGRYGDAEAVRITYDPSRISYVQLLQIYFSVAHNPTEVDRQGPDVGSQYRSEIFAASSGQARIAHAYIRQINRAKVFSAPIATQVAEDQQFFPAEAYHQDYAQKHPGSLYIRINDAPKVAALKARFANHYRPRAENLASTGS